VSTTRHPTVTRAFEAILAVAHEELRATVPLFAELREQVSAFAIRERRLPTTLAEVPLVAALREQLAETERELTELRRRSR
jgi:hypothetical protein